MERLRRFPAIEAHVAYVLALVAFLTYRTSAPCGTFSSLQTAWYAFKSMQKVPNFSCFRIDAPDLDL